MEEVPFPDSRPLAEADLLTGAAEAGDGELVGYRFAGLSDRVEWRRCECPWWHRLPFVGRFVHAELP